MKAILKKEWKSLFQGVTGWLFLAVTLGLFGLYFYVYNLMYGYPDLANTLSAITFIQMITVPILTMRVLAEERKNKTDQLLLTAPVSVGKIVVGKYLSMAAVFTIAVAVMAVTPLFLNRFGTIPFAECYVSILGYWLFGLTCIAVGTFISSLTESQVISAVLTFAALFLGYMMNGITGLISSTGNWMTKLLGAYDLCGGLDEFFNGILDIRALLYYVSVIGLMLFFTTQSIQKRRWTVSSKKIKTGVFSTGSIVAAVAVVVMVNLIAGQLPEKIKSIDATSQKLFTITEDTQALLDELQEDITIYVLVNEKSRDELVGRTLEKYADYSDHITVEYKDPAVFPSFYTNYSDSSVSQNSLIVEGEKRYKVISYHDLYESSIDYTTYTSSTTGYDGEGQITSAISYVTKEDMPVVYQLTGHEEQPLGSTFKDAIAKLNVTLETLNLLEVDEIPKDTQALIVNAPAKDLSKEDAKKILSYLENGGKAVLTVGFTEDKLDHYQEILEAYGVEVADGVLMEGDRSNYYQMPYYILTTASYDAATAQVSGDYIFVPYAVGLTYPRETEEEENAITYTELLTTTDSAYAKADVAKLTTLDMEEGDQQGPFVMGLHVEAPVSDGENRTDLYVFSSDSIFTDEISQMVYGNNATLFTGVLSQCTQTESVSVIPVKAYDYSQLTIHQTGVILGGLVLAILIPVVLLVIGIVIWVKRRRR